MTSTGSAHDEQLERLGPHAVELHGVGGTLTLERLVERFETGAFDNQSDPVGVARVDEGASGDSQRTEVLLAPGGPSS